MDPTNKNKENRRIKKPRKHAPRQQVEELNEKEKILYTETLTTPKHDMSAVRDEDDLSRIISDPQINDKFPDQLRFRKFKLVSDDEDESPAPLSP